MESKLTKKMGMSGKEQRKIALAAGFGLLLMTLVVGAAEGLAMSNIVDIGDTGATIANITAQEGLFRFGIFGHLLVILLDIFVAWALYVYLKPLNKPLSLLAAWMRVVYSVFYGIALLNYFQLVQLVGAQGFGSLLGSGEIETQATMLINGFRNIWNLGYIFFGLHLALLGWILFRSGVVPKWLGILVLVGGGSYLIDYICNVLFVNFNPNVSLIFGWGELIFMLWLLFFGGKERRKSKAA